MSERPPKLAEKILSKLQYDDVWKTTLGDFEEYYTYLKEKEGFSSANIWYWKQVLHYAPSKITHKIYWSVSMFKNYLKISFRTLIKQKSYSFINIIGLGIGLTAFFLISLFVSYEFNYDSFHENGDRTYRIIAQQPDNEYLGSNWYAITPTAMAATLKEDFPDVEYATYFTNTRTVLRTSTDAFSEWGVAADGDFFDIFTYVWYAGNQETALVDPYSIILTQSMAQKLFGDENPINRTIEQVYPNGKITEKTVTGVVANPPENSHFDFSFIANDQTTPYYNYNLNEWSNTNVYTFVQVRDGINEEDFAAKLDGFADTYISASEYYQDDLDALPNHALQPLEEIHLSSSNLNFNPSSTGDIKFVRMFAIVAVIILLIACVNYMNLSTARALTRGKEVGVRKVIGAYKSNLIMQFLSEAVIVSFISIIAAILAVFVLLPFFGDLINRDLNTAALMSWQFWTFVIAIGLVVGVVSGSYPAFYLSGQKPITVLKGNLKSGSGNTFFRNTLVIGQFSVTVILLISAIVVFEQLNFLRTTDTGLKREQIVSIPNNDPELWDRFETVKTELIKQSGIEMVTASQANPIYMSSRTSGTVWEGQEEGEELPIYVSPVHFDFQEMFGIDLVSGTPFSKDTFKETEASYIVNEAAIHELGWGSDDAIGKPFSVWGNDGYIVGVAEDFNFLSLDQPIAPLVLMLAPQYDSRYLLVKTNGENIQETMSKIEETLKTFSPGYPFSFSFLDESYENMYRDDIRMGELFNYFSIFALIIASLGLFGLATYIAERRTKEIGIRKVLGANLFQILTLLNKDFLKLVVVSFLIAGPIGWYLASTWLEDFAFRIELGPMVFIVAGVLTILVALFTVSYKSLRTGLANPVESLKNE